MKKSSLFRSITHSVHPAYFIFISMQMKFQRRRAGTLANYSSEFVYAFDSSILMPVFLVYCSAVVLIQTIWQCWKKIACSFIGVRQRGVDLQHLLADRGERVRLRRRAHLRRPQARLVLRVQRLYVRMIVFLIFLVEWVRAGFPFKTSVPSSFIHVECTLRRYL